LVIILLAKMETLNRQKALQNEQKKLEDELSKERVKIDKRLKDIDERLKSEFVDYKNECKDMEKRLREINKLHNQQYEKVDHIEYAIKKLKKDLSSNFAAASETRKLINEGIKNLNGRGVQFPSVLRLTLGDDYNTPEKLKEASIMYQSHISKFIEYLTNMNNTFLAQSTQSLANDHQTYQVLLAESHVRLEELNQQLAHAREEYKTHPSVYVERELEKIPKPSLMIELERERKSLIDTWNKGIGPVCDHCKRIVAYGDKHCYFDESGSGFGSWLWRCYK
jgi:hypothetical protein